MIDCERLGWSLEKDDLMWGSDIGTKSESGNGPRVKLIPSCLKIIGFTYLAGSKSLLGS